MKNDLDFSLNEVGRTAQSLSFKSRYELREVLNLRFEEYYKVLERTVVI